MDKIIFKLKNIEKSSTLKIGEIYRYFVYVYNKHDNTHHITHIIVIEYLIYTI